MTVEQFPPDYPVTTTQLANELALLRSRCARLERELRFWAGVEPKHEGDCEFSDKVDEGCYLCRRAENERYPAVATLLHLISLPEPTPVIPSASAPPLTAGPTPAASAKP